MHVERAFRVINLLDIPVPKRKFWPQHSGVVVSRSTREILDVVQLFTVSSSEYEKYFLLYPNAVMFFADAGWFLSVADLEAKIAWCFERHENTYVVGHGMVTNFEKWPTPDDSNDSAIAPNE